jgi:hypothetical protein
MGSSTFIFGRRCLALTAGLAALLAGGDCLAVISYRLPEIQVAANPSGATTGTFNVSVNAAPGDLPKQIGAFNLDFIVGSGSVALSQPTASVTSLIPTVTPLLSDPGPPGNPFIVNFSPNQQTIRVGHDVMTDQPLMDGKNLVTVRFTVPAGVTGTFPLTFGAAQNNLLVEGTATQLPVNLADTGQITIVPAGVPGDYNNNGVVDAADYAVWRDRLGTATTLPNEVSGVTPGSVTNEDYAAWRARFGRTSGSGSGASLAFAAAVPEPSSAIVLAAFALLMLLGTRAVWRPGGSLRPGFVVVKRPEWQRRANDRST